MEVQEYISKKKDIQACLLNYLVDGTDDEYYKLIKLINESDVSDNRYELKSILQLINAIIQNYHRSTGFFNKIDKILSNYILNIKKHFTKSEVYEIFSPNQRTLYFLLQNDLISTDDLLKLDEYRIGYFYPEIKTKIRYTLLNQIESSNKEIFENFNEDEFNKKRLVGENDTCICKLIREDSIAEFVKYVNQTNYPLNKPIEWSLFETNSFLIEEHKYDPMQLTLIYYAYFFGSIQIVKYLIINGQKLTTYLWPYAIHSNNAELIQMLVDGNFIPQETYFMTRRNKFIRQHPEENLDVFYDQETQKKSIWDFQTFKTTLVQSIECHNNDTFQYIMDNAAEMKPESKLERKYDSKEFQCDSRTDVTFAKFKYYNYICFPDDIDDQTLFFCACKYDYPAIVDLFLKNKKVDINTMIVLH